MSQSPSIYKPATDADRFSRRALLRRMGIGAAALPLIHAERSFAATASGFPKRMVLITWTNGVIADSFYPASGAELNLTGSLAALAPYAAKILQPMGLDQKVLMDKGRLYDGHFAWPSLWSGTADTKHESRKALGPSIDQFVSDAIAQKVMLTNPILHVGVRSIGDGEPATWRASGQKNVPEIDPGRLFNSLFAGANLSAPQIDSLRQRRKSVLDFVAKELTGFRTRLGNEDRAKIDAHNDSLRAVEKLLAGAGSSGAACTAPPNPGAAKLDVPTTLKTMYDLIAVALRCDITRVATIDIYDDGGGDGNSFAWLDVNRDYHQVAHAGKNAAADKVKIDTWLFSNVANLVKQLNDTVEGGGTALDNSLVVTGNGMCDGADHGVNRVPFLIVGSAGGYLNTGRTVRYDKLPHNRLLATLCNAMDVPVTSYGAPGYEGTLPELVKT